MSRLRQLIRPVYFLRRALLPLYIALFLLASSAWAQPNIVVIMTDDLGLRPFNQLLQQGWLPNIQNYLIDSGVEFNNAFVTNSACCPSRVTFLRGQYSHNHRVFSNHSPDHRFGGIYWPGWFSKNGVAGRNESTIATWLQDAGYHTGYVGKYLNGYGRVAPDGVANPTTYIPPGWNEWFAAVSITTYRVYNYVLNQNGSLVLYGETEADYQTDVYSNLAVNFIQQATQSSEPFFLFISSLAPHVEVADPGSVLIGNEPNTGLASVIRPAPRHEYLIDGNLSNGEMADLPNLPSFNEVDISDKPTCPRPPVPVEPAIITDPVCIADMPLYNADPHIPNVKFQAKTMMTSMLAVDDMVGNVVTELTNAGVLDNTVIIFASDNGWLNGEHRMIGKSLAYDESIRVPLVIRSPSGTVNAKSEQIVLNNDLAPTIADLAGVTAPYDMDGASLVPILGDPVNVSWPRRMFFYEHFFVPSTFKFELATQFAVRRKLTGTDFSYIATHADTSNPTDPTHHEFYNLLFDPYQMNSVALPEPMTTLLDLLLHQFLLCSGSGCRSMENF